jgi:hypothetical protein
MFVVGQHVGQARVPHGLHRNAVCEAVAFIGTGLVENKPGKKASPSLRNDAHIPIRENIVDNKRSFKPQLLIGGGEVSNSVSTSSVVTMNCGRSERLNSKRFRENHRADL